MRRRKAPVREKKTYDTSVRAFSPDGSIYQVEYAAQAADKGGLTIGVQTDKGLVLAAHGRRRSPLLKASSVSKIADVDDGRMCCAMSGLLPDGRLLLDYARTWVQEHRFEFDEAPSVEAVASQLSRLALKFNGYDKDGKAGNGGREEEDGGGPAMSRPVGVALLMAGVDRGDRPVLYHLDPSGAYVQWRARAIGDKGAAAEAKLEGVGPFEGMSVRRAMAAVLGVLREVLGDDEFSTDRLEMVCVDMMGGGRGSGDGGGGETGVCSSGAEHATTSASDHDNVGGAGDGAISGPRFAGEGSSVGAAPPSLSGGGISDGIASGARSLIGRDSGSSGVGGVLEGGVEVGQEDGSSAASGVGRSSAAASVVPRYGYFRRVPKSEMDELLAGSTRGDGEEPPTAANG
ncbi:unnamed protein product [Ectocarpus sp. CCAP 1310/34]|nr:unnamed protein product [Ectocarpus sp. CCAP 1310/34]